MDIVATNEGSDAHNVGLLHTKVLMEEAKRVKIMLSRLNSTFTLIPKIDIHIKCVAR